MQKGVVFTVISLVVGAFTLSCVSPFYGTARIEKGWHTDAGIAGCTFANTLGTLHYLAGIRGDCEIRYGFNKYLQASGRVGFGGGYEILDDSQEPDKNDPFFLLDGAIGVQGAYPFKKITPALRVEAGSGVSVMPLIGFGDHEWMTIGGRIWISYETEDIIPDFFITAHPWPRWSIFAGVNVITLFSSEWDYPLASLGVGYKLLK